MKKIVLLLSLVLSLLAEDIVVFTNEYNILHLEKKVKKLIVGNKETINVALLGDSEHSGTLLKVFGKQSGNTSILVIYRDGTLQNYQVYVNENMGFVQKMINVIEPNLILSKVANGSTVISGIFSDPHDKNRIYDLLQNAGVDMSKLMDLTQTKKVNKMIRTKLYLVEINNQKAKDLGGVTGLGFFSEYINASINPSSANGATFSGWLLDNTAAFSSAKGRSVTGTLNFLEEVGIGTIMDDTVLMSTEDKNASFRVGGEVYIPIGMTQNMGLAPTIQLEEREYGLRLLLNTKFMEKEGFMRINIEIQDSEFDTNKDHDVQLGADIFVPSFVSKNMQTDVVVKSGEVIALGGRLHSEDVETKEKVPFLGDIPLLGELFTHTVSANKQNDLLFFLVPEIVDANEDTNDTHFYKEFKETSKTFHKDMQTLKADVNTQDQTQQMVIELEDESQNSAHVEPITQVQKPLEDLDFAKENTEQKNDSLSAYKINVGKVFLRDAPVDGKRSFVWIKGHEFRATEDVSGKWLQIQEDCLQGCKAVEKELWIAKVYADKV